MNIKHEIIALGVRVLAETGIIRKPAPFEELLNTMFGGESYDQRMAREIETAAAKIRDNAQRVNTNRKFKKITENV